MGDAGVIACHGIRSSGQTSCKSKGFGGILAALHEKFYDIRFRVIKVSVWQVSVIVVINNFGTRDSELSPDQGKYVHVITVRQSPDFGISGYEPQRYNLLPYQKQCVFRIRKRASAVCGRHQGFLPQTIWGPSSLELEKLMPDSPMQELYTIQIDGIPRQSLNEFFDKLQEVFAKLAVETPAILDFFVEILSLDQLVSEELDPETPRLQTIYHNIPWWLGGTAYHVLISCDGIFNALSTKNTTNS
ncbi:hypothetical protein DFS33DRAFT_1277146 [Desarmillaria ectypa]|nr:hypothetical protein DFS33DRAFT_1277146 [Desarmillaria ectypa]